MKILLFSLNNQNYALPLEEVEYIERVHPITSIPNSFDYILGLTDIRDKIYPVMDLRKRLGMESTEFSNDTRFIIVQSSKNHIVITVDSADEVLDIQEDDIQPMNFGENKAVKGIIHYNDKLIVLLNLSTLLSGEDVQVETMLT